MSKSLKFSVSVSFSSGLGLNCSYLASTNGKRVHSNFGVGASFIVADIISLCTSQGSPSSAGLTCDCEANGIKFCGTFSALASLLPQYLYMIEFWSLSFVLLLYLSFLLFFLFKIFQSIKKCLTARACNNTNYIVNFLIDGF